MAAVASPRMEGADGRGDDAEPEESIRVCVRIRPLSSKEIGEGSDRIEWQFNERNIVDDSDIGRKAYTFDKVFGPVASNTDVYTGVARQVVMMALQGYNGTVFAYGQTGSGKTYSMLGTDADPGILPLTVDDVFAHIDHEMTLAREKGGSCEFLVRVSYLEVYNEEINDLLQPLAKGKGRNLKILRDDPSKGAIIEGLLEEIVVSKEQVMDVVSRGESNRHYGSTNMNAGSSRSHTVFRMVLESRTVDGTSNAESAMDSSASGSGTPSANAGSGEPEEEAPEAAADKWHSIGGKKVESSTVRVAYLNLVDLAGSERQEAAGTSGDRLREGSHINKSLSALALVISKLAEASKRDKERSGPGEGAGVNASGVDVSAGTYGEGDESGSVSGSVCESEHAPTIHLPPLDGSKQRGVLFRTNSARNLDAGVGTGATPALPAGSSVGSSGLGSPSLRSNSPSAALLRSPSFRHRSGSASSHGHSESFASGLKSPALKRVGTQATLRSTSGPSTSASGSGAGMSMLSLPPTPTRVPNPANTSVGGGSSDGGMASPTEHIPYRNSKLTRLLRQSLGGNTFTAILCAMSPANVNKDESVSSLKFATQCKSIRNRAVLNKLVDDKTLLKQYRQRITELRSQMASKQTQLQAAVALLIASAGDDPALAEAASVAGIDVSLYASMASPSGPTASGGAATVPGSPLHLAALAAVGGHGGGKELPSTVLQALAIMRRVGTMRASSEVASEATGEVSHVLGDEDRSPRLERLSSDISLNTDELAADVGGGDATTSAHVDVGAGEATSPPWRGHGGSSTPLSSSGDAALLLSPSSPTGTNLDNYGFGASPTTTAANHTARQSARGSSHAGGTDAHAPGNEMGGKRDSPLAAALREIDGERRRAEQLEKTVSRLQSLIIGSSPGGARSQRQATTTAEAGGVWDSTTTEELSSPHSRAAAAANIGSSGAKSRSTRRRASVAVTNDAGIASLRSFAASDSPERGASAHRRLDSSGSQLMLSPHAFFNNHNHTSSYRGSGNEGVEEPLSPMPSSSGNPPLSPGFSRIKAAEHSRHPRAHVHDIFAGPSVPDVDSRGWPAGGGTGSSVDTMVAAVEAARERQQLARQTQDVVEEDDVLSVVANVLHGHADLRDVLTSVAKASRDKKRKHAEELAWFDATLKDAYLQLENARAQSHESRAAALQLAQELAALRGLYEQQSSELNALRVSAAHHEQLALALQGSEDHTRHLMEELHATRSAVESDRHALQAQLDSAQAHATHLEEQLAAAHNAQAASREEVTAILLENGEQAKAQAIRLQNEVEALQGTVHAQGARLAEQDALIQALERGAVQSQHQAQEGVAAHTKREHAVLEREVQCAYREEELSARTQAVEAQSKAMNASLEEWEAACKIQRLLRRNIYQHFQARRAYLAAAENEYAHDQSSVVARMAALSEHAAAMNARAAALDARDAAVSTREGEFEDSMSKLQEMTGQLAEYERELLASRTESEREWAREKNGLLQEIEELHARLALAASTAAAAAHANFAKVRASEPADDADGVAVIDVSVGGPQGQLPLTPPSRVTFTLPIDTTDFNEHTGFASGASIGIRVGGLPAHGLVSPDFAVSRTASPDSAYLSSPPPSPPPKHTSSHSPRQIAVGVETILATSSVQRKGASVTAAEATCSLPTRGHPGDVQVALEDIARRRRSLDAQWQALEAAKAAWASERAASTSELTSNTNVRNEYASSSDSARSSDDSGRDAKSEDVYTLRGGESGTFPQLLRSMGLGTGAPDNSASETSDEKSSLHLLAMGLAQVARLQQTQQLELDARAKTLDDSTALAAAVVSSSAPHTLGARANSGLTSPVSGGAHMASRHTHVSPAAFVPRIMPGAFSTGLVVTPNGTRARGASAAATSTGSSKSAGVTFDTSVPFPGELRDARAEVSVDRTTPVRVGNRESGHSSLHSPWGSRAGEINEDAHTPDQPRAQPPPTRSQLHLATQAQAETQLDSQVQAAPQCEPGEAAPSSATNVPSADTPHSTSPGGAGVDAAVVAALSVKLRATQGDLRLTESALKTEVNTAGLLRSEADALRRALAHVTSQAQLFAKVLDALKETGAWDPRDMPLGFVINGDQPSGIMCPSAAAVGMLSPAAALYAHVPDYVGGSGGNGTGSESYANAILGVDSLPADGFITSRTLPANPAIAANVAAYTDRHRTRATVGSVASPGGGGHFSGSPASAQRMHAATPPPPRRGKQSGTYQSSSSASGAGSGTAHGASGVGSAVPVGSGGSRSDSALNRSVPVVRIGSSELVTAEHSKTDQSQSNSFCHGSHTLGSGAPTAGESALLTRLMGGEGASSHNVNGTPKLLIGKTTGADDSTPVHATQQGTLRARNAGYGSSSGTTPVSFTGRVTHRIDID